jgi:hypothetical protein
MKSYIEWKYNECKGDSKIKKDGRGGLVPADMKKAKHVDLITLPANVPGTNCSNCKHMEKDGDHGWCNHPEIEMPVNHRMCCKYWDNAGVHRPWGKIED